MDYGDAIDARDGLEGNSDLAIGHLNLNVLSVALQNGDIRVRLSIVQQNL
jgi:hypothetical protein